MLPVSRDTLLRVVRRRAPVLNAEPVRVLGIDDFAWKRGQRYGTILSDLEVRRIIDLLPDREVATVEAWLLAHPEITVVSRDRGGGYGQAAANAAPQAMQVADRWHPYGECQRRFSGGGASVDAWHSPGRYRLKQSAHRRRAAGRAEQNQATIIADPDTGEILPT
jgi:transposase